jgi:twitching motility protein PilT
VGPHTHSFANALRAALREDPDVILVGEMRDLETISLAVSAAETGHLVFGTLHTSSAAQTIDRIIDVFPAHQQAQIRAQLSESIRGVVAQTLLKTASGRGRVAAVEILVSTPAVRNLIREGKTFQLPSVIQTGVKEGMQTIEQSLSELVLEGRVTQDEAIIKAPDREAFLKFLAEAGRMTGADTNGASAPAQPASPPPSMNFVMGRLQK